MGGGGYHGRERSRRLGVPLALVQGARVTILDFLRLTRRHWMTLVIALAVGLLVGGGYGLFAPKTYKAGASGFVTVSGSNVFAGTEAVNNQVASYLPLLQSQPVIQRIAKDAGVDPNSLNGSLSATMATGASLINVTATAATPQTALTLANGSLSALAAVIEQVQGKAGSSAGQITVIPMQSASAPSAPASPNMKLALGVGALAGLVIGYIIVFLRRGLDTRVRRAAELTELSGAGLLGRIPKLGTKGTNADDQVLAQAGEPLRQIRSGLRFASVDKRIRSIVVTSANQSEGKSTVTAALARVIAEGGQRTLLIDGDLRRPTVEHTFGIDGRVGLSEVLSGQVSLEDAVRPTEHPNLLVLPAGGTPPNPSEMLGSEAMRSLIRTLADDCLIVIDAPPVLPVTDALLISTATDGTIFVAASGKTRKAEVTAARELLAQAKAHVIGVILNLVPLRDSADGYSYYRQYRSYYAQGGKKAETTAGTTGAEPAAPRHRPRTAAAEAPGPRRRGQRERQDA